MCTPVCLNCSMKATWESETLNEVVTQSSQNTPPCKYLHIKRSSHHFPTPPPFVVLEASDRLYSPLRVPHMHKTRGWPHSKYWSDCPVGREFSSFEHRAGSMLYTLCFIPARGSRSVILWTQLHGGKFIYLFVKFISRTEPSSILTGLWDEIGPEVSSLIIVPLYPFTFFAIIFLLNHLNFCQENHRAWMICSEFLYQEFCRDFPDTWHLCSKVFISVHFSLRQ